MKDVDRVQVEGVEYGVTRMLPSCQAGMPTRYVSTPDGERMVVWRNGAWTWWTDQAVFEHILERLGTLKDGSEGRRIEMNDTDACQIGLSAGSIVPTLRRYRVACAHDHDTLRPGDTVVMVTAPNFQNLLLREPDMTLHPLCDKHEQYVHLVDAPGAAVAKGNS